MEVDRFTQIFFQMETEEGLFRDHSGEADPVWDIVRYAVFTSLFEAITKAEEPLSQPRSIPGITRRRLVQWGWLTVSALWKSWQNLSQLGKADFLCFVNSRYSGERGTPIDFAADNAMQVLAENGSVHVIESGYGLNPQLNVPALTGMLRRLQQMPRHTQLHLDQLFLRLGESESRYFGLIDPNLKQVIRRTYRRYLAERCVWKKIIVQSTPRLILMTQNGIQKGLIREARSFGIPVVECQHGVINLMHPAYSYPPDLAAGDAVLLPDVLLLFSEYWKKQCNMPGTQIIATGNDRFYAGGIRSTRKGPAVFVDAGIFHQYLSPVAVEVARALPDRLFTMKLHPSQSVDREAIEQEYSKIANLSVVGTDRNLRDLLTDTSDVVILQSTAAYEALDRGIPVHIIEKAGYRSHRDLFARPDVHLFSTVGQLTASLFQPADPPSAAGLFFEPFRPDEFRQFLRHRKIV